MCAMVQAITHGVPFFLSAVIAGHLYGGRSLVDLGKLRQIVEALIEEEGRMRLLQCFT